MNMNGGMGGMGGPLGYGMGLKGSYGMYWCAGVSDRTKLAWRSNED
jgi:hypothetical protein